MTTLDCSRLMIVFFAVSGVNCSLLCCPASGISLGLDLLGELESLSAQEKEQIKTWIYGLQIIPQPGIQHDVQMAP